MMKVSILVPCYNVEAFLPQCMDSIINQTYRDLQIILVDDGSWDNTLAIAKKYAGKDSRIEVYHQENQGVAAARNFLLSKIKGDYFLFIDSDDWIEPDMVEFMCSRVKKYGADMVTCGMVVNDNTPSTSFVEEKWNQEQTVKEFLRHVSFNGSLCNKLISVSLLHNDPRFHCGISYGEDALFCWDLFKNVSDVIVTNKQLYHYRMNDTSISHVKYDNRKMSGHLVWRQICQETEMLWPQFSNIAKATFAISDMWQLYYAIKSNYPKDKNIQKFQKHVRNSIIDIHRSGLIDNKKYIFACVASISYRLAGFLIRNNQ